MRTKYMEVGTRVCYTREFLAGCGAYTSDMAYRAGTYAGDHEVKSQFGYVMWDDELMADGSGRKRLIVKRYLAEIDKVHLDF